MSYWGNPRKRVEQLNIWQRIRKHNESLLEINPFIAYLWIHKTEGQSCTCVKDTSEQADKKCTICYGTKIVGGYERYGFNTVSMDSQYIGLELSNSLSSVTEIKPNRIKLSKGKETGEIITPFIQPQLNLCWFGFSKDDYVYDLEHSGIDYYWQEMGRNEWNPIINFPDLATVLRFVRFKIVLHRDNQTYKSPVWGMIQVRYQISDSTEIKLSRGKTSRKDKKRDLYGNIEEEGGVRMWTLNSPIVSDGCFIELKTGLRDNKRFRIVGFEQSEPGGILLSQHLSLRVLQQNEIYYKVF